MLPNSFESVSHGLKALAALGYTRDYNLRTTCLECGSGTQLSPDAFVIDRAYVFESGENPEDATVLYAIAGPEGPAGTLVNAYGTYADGTVAAIVAKLKIVRG